MLDIGCGRGKAWFVGAGRFVAGVDPCWAVLPEYARHYDLVAQAAIDELPFVDAAFDCVVTSHVLGHVAPAEKDSALAEVSRVLRPGGAFVSVVETDSSYPRVIRAKANQELYRVNFVETDGHVGLEAASKLVGRLERQGLRTTDVRKMESGLLHVRMYAKYFCVGYPDEDAGIRRRIALWRRLQRQPLLMLGYEVAMGSYHRLVEPWTTPLDNSMFVMLCAVKDR